MFYDEVAAVDGHGGDREVTAYAQCSAGQVERGEGGGAAAEPVSST